MVSQSTTQTIPADNSSKQKIPNIWHNVLANAKSNKSIKTKNLLILGDENCGKSTIVANFFRSASKPGFGNGLDRKVEAASSDDILNFSQTEESRLLMEASKSDIGLSYIPVDIKDEENEDTISRIGIYQIASDLDGDRELLKNTIKYDNYSETAIIIVLDWTKPSRFVKSLYRWFGVLSDIIDNIRTTQEGRSKYIFETEELEKFLQSYQEPSANSSGESSFNFTSANVQSNVLLPLEPGTLESNFGIPITIVCTKSDHMAQLERDQKLNDEDFDYIQQVLRSISLHYGAALFYTSLSQPSTYDGLYHYIVHRLLSKRTQPIADQDSILETSQASNANGRQQEDYYMDSDDDSEMDQTTEMNGDDVGKTGISTFALAYPFRLPAQVIERDLVRVPSGWDTKSKIQFLRDGFDVETTQKLWGFDCLRHKEYVRKLLELYANPASNLRYHLDRIVNEAQKCSSDVLSENKQYDEFAKIIELQQQQQVPRSLNSVFLRMINSSSSYSTNMKFGANILEEMGMGMTMAKMGGNDVGVSFENENEFFQRLYAEQQAQPDSIDFAEAGGRQGQGRVHLHSTNIPASFEITQSRYDSSESSLSTAQAPVPVPISASVSAPGSGGHDEKGGKEELFSNTNTSQNQSDIDTKLGLQQKRFDLAGSNMLSAKGLGGKSVYPELRGQGGGDQPPHRSVTMNVGSGGNVNSARAQNLSSRVDMMGASQIKSRSPQLRGSVDPGTRPPASHVSGSSVGAKSIEAAGVGASAGAGTGPFNQQVLTDFFQSLLTKKKAPATATASGTATGASVSASGSTGPSPKTDPSNLN